MTQRFCTLFDERYLARGLTLYRSLRSACPDFHLYVFAFDEATRVCLTAMALPQMTVVALADFEDAALLRVKPSRSAGEYCWTATPSALLYCLRAFDLDHCTYVDADLYFYADPVCLLEEMGDASILITPHRFTPAYDLSDAFGVYCVQFLTARHDPRGLAVLTWWRDACLAWCFNRCEDGRFGDQKYLDDWTDRFPGVHVLDHPGGGVAPWNLQQLSLTLTDAGLQVTAAARGTRAPLVFFHFHGLRVHGRDTVELTHREYRIPSVWRHRLYAPYVRQLMAAASEVSALSPVAAAPPHPVTGVSPSRHAQAFSIAVANVRGAVGALLGRRPTFHRVFNHVYPIDLPG